MRLAEIHNCLIKQLIVAVVFLLGFHGFSHSINFHHPEAKKEILSHRDRLIIEIVEFVQPDYKLTKDARKHIEGRIKRFPTKIIRRDTLSHFSSCPFRSLR